MPMMVQTEVMRTVPPGCLKSKCQFYKPETKVKSDMSNEGR